MRRMVQESSALDLLRREQAANRQRFAQKLTATQRTNLKRDKPYTFVGRDADSGNAVVAQAGQVVNAGEITSNALIKPGQSVRVLVAGGKVTVKQLPKRLEQPKPVQQAKQSGKIKILFSKVVGTERVFYVGGWQKTLKKVRTFPVETPIYSASVDNLGGDRWIANFCYQENGIFYVEYISGSEKWRFAVPASVNNLPICLGYGFWRSNPNRQPEALIESANVSDTRTTVGNSGTVDISGTDEKQANYAPPYIFSTWKNRLRTLPLPPTSDRFNYLNYHAEYVLSNQPINLQATLTNFQRADQPFLVLPDRTLLNYRNVDYYAQYTTVNYTPNGNIVSDEVTQTYTANRIDKTGKFAIGASNYNAFHFQSGVGTTTTANRFRLCRYTKTETLEYALSGTDLDKALAALSGRNVDVTKEGFSAIAQNTLSQTLSSQASKIKLPVQFYNDDYTFKQTINFDTFTIRGVSEQSPRLWNASYHS